MKFDSSVTGSTVHGVADSLSKNFLFVACVLLMFSTYLAVDLFTLIVFACTIMYLSAK